MLHNLMRGITYLCLVAMLAAIVGCSNNDSLTGNSQPEHQPPAFTVMQVSDEILIQLPDGNVADRSWLEDQAKALAEDHSGISFGSVAETDGQAPNSRFRVSKYWCDIHWDYDYVGGCIGRRVPHLNLIVRDTTIPGSRGLLFDAHLCVWWQNGPQFGIYNSANGQCKNTRGTFTSIRSVIGDFLSRMTPMPSWACYSIAYTAAVIVVCAFALSWV